MSALFLSLAQKTSAFAISIYCDGDSTTAYPNNYTLGIKAFLEGAFANLTVTVNNVAVSGQSQAQMLSDLQSQILANHPDILTISTYLNDTVEYNNGTLLGNLQTYVDATLAHVNPSGNSPLLLLMTDNLAGQNLTQSYARPYSTQIAVKNTVLSKFNTYKYHKNVWIIDRFAAYDNLGGANNPDSSALFSKLIADMVHPNLSGYTTIDQPLIYPVLKSMTEKLRLIK